MPLQPDQQHGFDFEEKLAADLGLDQVPGSGSGPIWKLDLQGFTARWSLKSTQFKSYPMNVDDIDEAVDVCLGPGGTGEVPMWGIRIHDDDHILICMTPDTFKRIASGELKLTQESKGEARRRRASVPALFREEGD